MPTLLVPSLTPLDDALRIDIDRLASHCRWLLAEGADGIALFGTTGEANSFSVEERMQTLEALVAAGIPAEKIQPGTGCCAITDTVTLSRHAAAQGCRRVLVLPPFYYKKVSEDGLFDAFAYIIGELSGTGIEMLLYHIPPVAGVGFTPALIRRLVDTYPATVVGIKDSSGDWSFTETLLAEFPDIAVFPGSEAFALAAVRRGGAGCITATGNINARAIRTLFDQSDPAAADRLNEKVVAFRRKVEAHVVIPAMKAVIAAQREDDGWRAVRPPFQAVSRDSVADIVDDLAARSEVLQQA